MIERLTIDAIRKHGPGCGTFICIGDQRPQASTGFKTSKDVGKHFGYSKCFDIDYNGKADWTLDLNDPIPAKLHESGNLIYDGGTLEHVANISIGYENLLNLCAVGGIIIQKVPLNCYGASYHGIDPMFQRHFFEANGFKTVYQSLVYSTSWRVRFVAFVMRHTSLEFQLKWQKILSRGKSRRHAALSDFVFQDAKRHMKHINPYGETFRKVPYDTHTFYVCRRVDRVPITWKIHQSIYEPCTTR